MSEDQPLGISLRTPPRREPFPEVEPLVKRMPTDSVRERRMADKLEEATRRAIQSWLRGHHD